MNRREITQQQTALKQQRKDLQRKIRDTVPGSPEESAIREQFEAVEQELRQLEVLASQSQTTPDETDPQVFICYAKEDEAFARQLYADLQQAGVSPWMACKDIWPGQNWEHEIQQALRRSTHVLVLLSSHSISKRSYVRKEIKQALDTLDEFPPSQIYLIPVRLDDSKPLDECLQKIHWVDLWPASAYKDGLQRLLQVFARRRGSKKSEETIDSASRQEAQHQQEPETSQDIKKQQTSRKQPKEKPPVQDTVTVHTPEVSLIQLRSDPIEVGEDEAQEAFNINGIPGQPRKYITNQYEDQGEIIIDHVTGLMWQRSGSNNRLRYAATQKYADQLNKKRFAGYSDWRLPTIPELMSLLEPEQQTNGLYINSIFDSKQSLCWSADPVAGSSGLVWDVDFLLGGSVHRNFHQHLLHLRCVRS